MTPRVETRLLHIWDGLIVLCAALSAIIIPVQLTFDVNEMMLEDYINLVITCIFWIDLYCNLPSSSRLWRPFPHRDLGAKHPIPLIVDLLAAMPWDYLTGFQALELVRLVKLLRIIPLLRLRLSFGLLFNTVFRLVWFVCWLGLLAHWLACGWLALHPDPAKIADNNANQYIWSLYWSVTTLTTVGYGDVTPSTATQAIFTMLAMILGVGVYGYVIGNVAHLLANIDGAKTQYRNTMQRLTMFMTYRNVPPPLRQRVYDYYNYLWENRMGGEENHLMAELPPILQGELSLALKHEFIKKVPFFQGASHTLIRDITVEMRPVVYLPGDVIFHAGEIGRHMYFVSKGTVEIVGADGITIHNILKEGDFFGEIALFYRQPRSAMARAIDNCDLYILDRNVFRRVLRFYPDFTAHLKNVARSRWEQGVEVDETSSHPRDC